MICVLAGGVGAARFLTGLVQLVPPNQITVIVNTADDINLHGLHIAPDLDTITYTLAKVHNAETGWGLANETWKAMDALRQLEGPTWFKLGDQDLGTHLYRTGRLADGIKLTEVTAEITSAFGLEIQLLPMTEERVETRVTLAAEDKEGAEIGFQEWFVGLNHNSKISAVRFDGIEEAQPGPEVLKTIENAETIVIAPSNPIVSIGPILAIPGITESLKNSKNKTVAISPIVAGATIKGPADQMMADLGYEPSVVGVADFYSEISKILVIDNADTHLANRIEELGTLCSITNTIMTDEKAATDLAKVVLESIF